MRTVRFATPVLMLVALSLSTCSSPPTTTRSGRLLTMAAEEAGYITDLSDRLTRQLNISDLQIQLGQKAEALKTLALATDTLKVEEAGATTKEGAEAKPEKKTLDEFGRIAGWTSVAELLHSAGNDTTAVDAYMNAVEALNSVQPEVKRAQYVLSLSQVAFVLRGKEEAGQLLVKGGEWASKIPDVNTRRFALTSFTTALVGYDDLDAARKVMRNEPDAAWRADTFSAMARQTQVIEAQRLAAGEMSAAKSMAASPALPYGSKEAGGFNKDVRYNARYRQDQMQQGMLPNAQDPTR